MVTGTTFHREGALPSWREVIFLNLYSNPWVFAVIQPFIGIATLFSGNCGLSNPILLCNPESPESLETTGVAGRCEPEVGSIATPPPFSCLLFDLAHTAPKPIILRLAKTGPTLARHGLRRYWPSVSTTQPCKSRHRAAQGPTGGNEWQRKSAPRYAMRSGLVFFFQSSVPDINFITVPADRLIQRKSSICSYP